MSTQYDHQVEVVVGVLIVRENKVLLIQSPKWGDLWLFPGGHVEYGERLFAAAEREGQEETGISMKAQYVIQMGENLFPSEYHRPAHMIYYHVVCQADSTEIKMVSKEISAAKWVDFPTALTMNLPVSNSEAIRRLQAGFRMPYESRDRA